MFVVLKAGNERVSDGRNIIDTERKVGKKSHFFAVVHVDDKNGTKDTRRTVERPKA